MNGLCIVCAMIVWIICATLSTDFYLKTFNPLQSARTCKRFIIKPFSALENVQYCLEFNSTKYNSWTMGVKEAIPENSVGEVRSEAGLKSAISYSQTHFHYFKKPFKTTSSSLWKEFPWVDERPDSEDQHLILGALTSLGF